MRRSIARSRGRADVARQGLDAERVLARALHVADADGLGAVTLSRLARELGVRTPSLYNHVAGREGLQRAIALCGMRELADAMRRAAVGRARADALGAVAGAYRAYARDHPGRFAATVAAPGPDDAELQAAARDAVEVITAIVAGWGLADEDALHAVRAIRSAIHGFVVIEASGGFGLPLDLDDSFARLVGTLAAGLEAAPGAAVRASSDVGR